jgi:aspartate aminotransferase
MIAERVALIPPSPIHSMADKVRERRLRGERVLDLTLGEPTFNTPRHIIEVAYKAMRDGKTHYTPIHGLPELRDAIRARQSAKLALDWNDDEVTTACGAKQVIFNAMLATLNRGDEVLLPTPCWSAYFDIVSLAGGIPVKLNCNEQPNFALSAEAMEQAITPRTKWLFLNSPANPTGSILPAPSLGEIAEVLRRHPGIAVLSDEIYDEIVFGSDGVKSILHVAPDLKGRTLVVNGVSKTYAMTGWRLGYAVGPKSVIRAMGIVQTQNATHTSSITQVAAVAALAGPQDCIREFLGRYRSRRDMLERGLRKLKGWHVHPAAGAFYLFPSVVGLLGARTPDGRTLDDDVSVAEYLLDSAGVAIVPGSGFSATGHVRLSFAADETVLSAALKQIGGAQASLQF